MEHAASSDNILMKAGRYANHLRNWADQGIESAVAARIEQPERAEHDIGIPDRIKEYIDDKVQGGMQAVGRGALAVLGSGFGKGLLVAAALFVIGTVAASVLFPVAMGFAATASAGTLVEGGLMIAGNTLLSSATGAAVLATGGIAGAMSEAYAENVRINADMAESQAELYKLARERQHTGAGQEFCNDVSGGKCAALLKKRAQDRDTGEQRGMA